MKRTQLLNALAVALTLVVAGVGCKKTPKTVTPIPARTVRAPGPGTGPGPLDTGGTVAAPGVGENNLGTKSTDLGTGGTPMAGMGEFEGYLMDTNVFAAATVHFDFDSSVVKRSEYEKTDSVAEQLKLKPEDKLLIDGHCDERGTEEYNRALGERRALALREYLIGKGIGGERIRTRSWGEDRPVDPGHNEEAWAKNRRGEFILLLPPTTTQ